MKSLFDVIAEWAQKTIIVAGAFLVCHGVLSFAGWDRTARLEAQVQALTDALNEQIEWRNTGVLMERPARLPRDSFWDDEPKTGIVR